MSEENKTILVVASLLLVGLLGTYFYEKASCKAKSISFDSHNYSVLGGCMVKHQGKWIPLENIRGFGDE